MAKKNSIKERAKRVPKHIKILVEVDRRIKGWRKMYNNNQDSFYKNFVKPLVRIDELKDLRKFITKLK